MMRIFIGIDIPHSIKEQIYSLRGGLENAHWHPMEKLHLTFSFIGDMDTNQLNALIRELRTVRFPAFNMAFKEVGYFATGTIPHHLWTGVDNPKVLEELADKIDNAVRRAGLKNPNQFKFMPHVSLARLNGTTMDEVFAYIGKNNLFHSDSFLLDHFCLFESIARENGEGKYYQIIEEFPLSLV